MTKGDEEEYCGNEGGEKGRFERAVGFCPAEGGDDTGEDDEEEVVDDGGVRGTCCSEESNESGSEFSSALFSLCCTRLSFCTDPLLSMSIALIGEGKAEAAERGEGVRCGDSVG